MFKPASGGVLSESSLRADRNGRARGESVGVGEAMIYYEVRSTKGLPRMSVSIWGQFAGGDPGHGLGRR